MTDNSKRDLFSGVIEDWTDPLPGGEDGNFGDDMGTPENPRSEMEKKFWEYHRKNPHIYWAFDRFSHEAVRSRRDSFGASMVIERVRWYLNVETDSDDGFKVNNNFKAYYARLWTRNNPQHKGLYYKRRLRAA